MPSNRRKAGVLSSAGFGLSPVTQGALFGAPTASQFPVDVRAWNDPANDRPTPRPALRAATKAKGTLTHAAANVLEKGALALGQSERDAAQLGSRFEQFNQDWNPLSMADIVGTQASLGASGDRDFSKSDLLSNAALLAAPEVLPLVAKGALSGAKKAAPTLRRLMADERGSLGEAKALEGYQATDDLPEGTADTLHFGNGRVANIQVLSQKGMDARLAQLPNPFRTAVAKDGAPVPVYHGTVRDQADFLPGHQRATWFAEKPELANRYADARAHRKASGGQVVPAYLDIRKPLDLDAPNPAVDPKFPWITNDPVGWAKHYGVDLEGKIEPGQYNTHDIWQRPAFAEAARAAGYDGLTATEGGTKTWAALAPDQIKPKLSDEGYMFAEEQKLPFAERQAFRDFMEPPAPQPLPGVPKADEFGPDPHLRSAASKYGEAAGRTEPGPQAYRPADPERGARIAKAFEDLKHDPSNPEVRKAYEALSRETMQQYEGLKQAGYRFDFHPDGVDPYPSPFDAVRDLRDNKRLSVYPTDAGYGTEGITPQMLAENPMLQATGETWSGKPVRVNDVFRAVHDAYGHAKEGFGFRASGEDMAYQAHAPMFSPEARRALATETRGQNSWLNFGPHGEANRTAKIGDTVFADQKIGLLPEEHVYDGLDLRMPDPEYDREFESMWGHGDYEGPYAGTPDADIPAPAPPSDGPLTADRVFETAASKRGSGEGYSDWKAGNDPTQDPLFDYSKLSEVPDVPQTPLPRYEPKRGPSPRIVAALDDPRVADGINGIVKRGMEQGGADRYNTEPLRQEYVKELGSDDAFKSLMDEVAATSPRSTVQDNIRTASYYHYLRRNGLPIPEKPPVGYGSVAQDLHYGNVRKLNENGGWDVFTNPKPASFSQNLQGNQHVATIDTHNFRLPGILSGNPDFLATSVKSGTKGNQETVARALAKRYPKLPQEAIDEAVKRIPKKGQGKQDLASYRPQDWVKKGYISMEDAQKDPVLWVGKPNANEYAHYENWQREQAKKLGISPAQYQASMWLGGGEETGLGSAAEPFLRTFENRVKYTASRLGMSAQDVLQGFIKGKHPLLSTGAVATAGALSQTKKSPQARPGA